MAKYLRSRVAQTVAMVVASAMLATGLNFIVQQSRAGVACSVPFTLTNGTVADATQVMANYNALITCLGLAAGAGINTDITALNGLTTPLAPASGGTGLFFSNTASTGSANVQAVTTTVPNNFSLTTGFMVQFVAGFTNTALMTLNVNGTGAKNVFRNTQLGSTGTAGGEVIAGAPVVVVYDGTQYRLVGQYKVVGKIEDFAGTSAPPGSVLAFGQAISRTTFADLFTVIGTTYGVGDGSTTFNVVDARGRVLPGVDNMGGSAANRIGTVTTDSGVITGATLGSAGGSATHAQTTAEVGAHNHTITDPGHSHGVTQDAAHLVGGGGLQSGGAAGSISPATITINNGSTGITINNSAASSAMAILPPALMMNKIIHF